MARTLRISPGLRLNFRRISSQVLPAEPCVPLTLAIIAFLHAHYADTDAATWAFRTWSVVVDENKVVLTENNRALRLRDWFRRFTVLVDRRKDIASLYSAGASRVFLDINNFYVVHSWKVKCLFFMGNVNVLTVIQIYRGQLRASAEGQMYFCEKKTAHVNIIFCIVCFSSLNT